MRIVLEAKGCQVRGVLVLLSFLGTVLHWNVMQGRTVKSLVERASPCRNAASLGLQDKICFNRIRPECSRFWKNSLLSVLPFCNDAQSFTSHTRWLSLILYFLERI